MPFPPEERNALLALKGVGPTVIARLEQMGYESLAHLSKANALDIVAGAAALLGSSCWKNSPQARAAITAAIGLARSRQPEPVVRRLLPEELDWANACYAEIGFLPSTAADFVAVAEWAGERAALGRIVPLSGAVGELGGMYVLPAYRGRKLAARVLDYLIANAATAELFCIPFAHLQGFYASHGFAPVPKGVQIPCAIAAKCQWCKASYDTPIGLLYRAERAGIKAGAGAGMGAGTGAGEGDVADA